MCAEIFLNDFSKLGIFPFARHNHTTDLLDSTDSYISLLSIIAADALTSKDIKFTCSSAKSQRSLLNTVIGRAQYSLSVSRDLHVAKKIFEQQDH